MSAIVTTGDARDLPFPDESVDLIVTSPPYFGLRKYAPADGSRPAIGEEPDPREFVAALVECTREMARVLKSSGSIFVNLGDKYSGAQRQTQTGAVTGRREQLAGQSSSSWAQTDPRRTGIPGKSLMLLPERYRIACTDELGLIARAVIIWSKPNGMPESVRDRVRRSHEDWVHLTKSPRYFEAVDEIREPITMRPQRWTNGRPADSTPRQGQPRQAWSTAGRDEVGVDGHPLGKLPGSVWTVATQPLRVPAELEVDHFAAFPMEWPRRLITGWCPREVCSSCGQGRRPVTSRETVPDAQGRLGVPHTGDRMAAHSVERKLTEGIAVRSITGYACACPDTTAPATPGVVLDPFGGTGTTALVADVLGRVGISLDASEDYGRLARWRTTDEKQRARAGQAKPSPEIAVMGPATEGDEPEPTPTDALLADAHEAQSVDELRVLARQAVADELWTDDVRAVFTARRLEIEGAAA